MELKRKLSIAIKSLRYDALGGDVRSADRTTSKWLIEPDSPNRDHFQSQNSWFDSSH